MTGRLVYLIGPSGAGKDSLIAYARAAEPAGVVFAHRYITRPAGAGGENHVALSPAEFARRRAAGCFALSWTSHGLDYGLGREIDLWCAAGLAVVANGSRAALPAAAARFPDLLPVLVTVDVARLAARLHQRERASDGALEARLARATSLAVAHPALVRLDNNGPIERAGAAFLGLLEDWRNEGPSANPPTR